MTPQHTDIMFTRIEANLRADREFNEGIAQLRAAIIRRRRWYYAPVRLWRKFRAGMLFAVVLAAAAPADAATMTPCSGSWDGPGMTACELLGRPGVVGGARDIDWTSYFIHPVPLHEITAYDATNSWRVDQMGQIVYLRAEGHERFTLATLLHPDNFATWCTDDRRTCDVGVEDLWLFPVDATGSDWDYNDVILHAVILDDTPFGVPVPEMAPLGLILMGIAAILRRVLER